jgi:hypothetical protein
MVVSRAAQSVGWTAELMADVKVDLKVDQTVVLKDVHLAEMKVE